MSVNEAETLFNSENSRVLPFCAGRIMNDPVDGDTVRLAMDGDDKAFSSLFMNTYRYVYTVARHYLSNDEDIYDAIQETYTKVYANIGRLKDPEAFHSWLGKIAENSAKDIISANGRPTSELNDETDEYLNDTSAESSKNEVNMDITAVFSQLSQEDAQLLTYIYYDGFKVTEVARMQGLAVTTVYSRLNAAKRRLKQLLKLRGIEKPVYGGDIVALITTVIRNAIGTNLLSAAVADEILQSVTGQKSKAGVVISAVARKQRNAAVLRIASLIVLIVILTVGVFMGMYFAVRSALKGGAPTGGSGSDTIGVSTEVGSTDESNSSNASGSELDASSAGQSVIGGVEQSRPNTQSESGGSSDTDSTNSTDQTVSEGNTSTGTSGDISDTSDPDSGDGTPDTNTSSGGTSSQKPLSSVITSSSKPSASSTTSSTTSSRPSTSSTTTSSKPSTSSTAMSSSTTSSGGSTSEVSVVNYAGNTSNNLHNKILNGNIAKQGDWIYYTKETYSGSDQYGLYKVKTDGTGYTILHTSDFEMSQLNVTGNRIYYNEAYRVYTISTDGIGCRKVSNFSQEVYSVYTFGDYVYATVATEPSITLYKSPITSGSHSWSIVSGYNNSEIRLSDDGKYLYISEAGSTATTANYYRYNIASGEKTLVASDVNSKGCMMIYGDYLAYPIYNTARTVKYNVVSVNNPSKIINTYYPSYTYCSFFSSYNGGTLGFDFNTSGTIYNMSGQSAAVTDMSFSGVASTFPNDDHIYYLSGGNLYMALPDGSKIVRLK